jgi:hypothetical protein
VGRHFIGDDGVLGFLRRRRAAKLDAKLANTDARLALMNAQLAAQMVQLAGQTNDLAPLKQAEEALSSARNYYTFETTPVEIGMVQVALGNMLLKLGKAKSDKAAIARAKTAFRAAITLASLHGDDSQREELREKVKLTESLMGHRAKTPSLFRAA